MFFMASSLSRRNLPSPPATIKRKRIATLAARHLHAILRRGQRRVVAVAGADQTKPSRDRSGSVRPALMRARSSKAGVGRGVIARHDGVFAAHTAAQVRTELGVLARAQVSV